MSQEILINVNQHEIRVALIENKILQEMHIERNLQQGLLVGNIYKGKVTRLVPGIQAAFIDIGLEKAAFLHVSDLLPESAEESRENTPSQDIRDYLHIGQKILVQVYKDQIGTKGARLTTQFTIPSRFLVLTPNFYQVAISQKITDPNMRERLSSMIQCGQHGGYIFRTVSEMATQDEINQDKLYLDNLWENISSKIHQATNIGLIYEEIPIVLRVLRDLVGLTIQRILVDDQATLVQMQEYAETYIPSLAQHISLHTENKPIFALYDTEEELQKALERKVSLPSGGYLVFDQTEAMTTIDVNTGSYISSKTHDVILKTNLEAAEAIVRQVRLRNLGGIIIIDFIDLPDAAQREFLLQTFNQALQKDSAKTHISELSSLGLVQMTRKRSRESLEQLLYTPCPTCKSRGMIKSIETICHEIFREIKNIATYKPAFNFLITVSTDVAAELLNQNLLQNFEKQLNRKITLKTETNYQQNKYDILPLAQ